MGCIRSWKNKNLNRLIRARWISTPDKIFFSHSRTKTSANAAKLELTHSQSLMIRSKRCETQWNSPNAPKFFRIIFVCSAIPRFELSERTRSESAMLFRSAPRYPRIFAGKTCSCCLWRSFCRLKAYLLHFLHFKLFLIFDTGIVNSPLLFSIERIRASRTPLGS